jgi:hypothetical protein
VLFVVATIVAILWLIFAIVRACRTRTINDVIDEIRAAGQKQTIEKQTLTVT